MNRILVKDLTFSFNTDPVLESVSAVMERGKFIAVIGPNGAGKTTFMRCVLGLLAGFQGRILFDDTSIKSMSKKALSKLIGYVPQNGETVFSLPVYEAVLLGRRPHIDFAVKPRDLEIVDSIIRELDLTKLTDRSVSELSGGERQKVFISRALAQEPEALFLDEPTSALDLKHQIEVLTILKRLVVERNKLVVVVMHDIGFASRFADSLFLMNDGRIYSSGNPRRVLTEENLLNVYDIEASITWNQYGPHIDVIKTLDRAEHARKL